MPRFDLGRLKRSTTARDARSFLCRPHSKLTRGLWSHSLYPPIWELRLVSYISSPLMKRKSRLSKAECGTIQVSVAIGATPSEDVVDLADTVLQEGYESNSRHFATTVAFTNPWSAPDRWSRAACVLVECRTPRVAPVLNSPPRASETTFHNSAPTSCQYGAERTDDNHR